ncbi:MAG: rhomboid family intramembrane serine protease [Niastella sp.]|nr:rhomboid family intramembrane serine protease [Niastella sp.]
MGEADRYSEFKQHTKRYRYLLGDDRNALVNLLIINIIFFLLLYAIKVGYQAFEKPDSNYLSAIFEYFALPAHLSVLSERPWTIITWMFSEATFWSFFANMIWLWCFGSLLQSISGNTKIIPVYLYGGFVGGLFFIAGFYLFIHTGANNSNIFINGANASVMAVATAVVMLTPTYRILPEIRGGVPIWILLAIYIFIDVIKMYHAALPWQLSHLGGALAGVIFVILLHKGWDGSLWMNRFYHTLMNLFNPSGRGNNKTSRESLFYEKGNRSPYQKSPNITQQRVDEILDKINTKGYHFLTDEEKKILKKASEDNSL